MAEDRSPTPPDELLARAPLFARLDDKSLKRLSALCVPRTYEKDALIITEGSTGLGLFVLTSGRVEVYMGDGDDRVSLAVVEPGAILGEMALIDDQPRSATAVALEETSCLLITRSSFRKLVENDPKIAWCLVPVLAERVRALQGQIIDGLDGGTIAPATEDPTEAVLPRKPVVEDSGDEDDGWLGGLARGQYALTMAGIVGMRGALAAMESFMRRLVDRADEDGEERRLEDLPADFLAAAESGLGEAEKLPERMLSRYRQYRKRAK